MNKENSKTVLNMKEKNKMPMRETKTKMWKKRARNWEIDVGGQRYIESLVVTWPVKNKCHMKKNVN